MAKVSRTQTHVKIYLTPLEVTAFAHIMLEGVNIKENEDQWSAAHDRVESTIGNALGLADQIAKASGAKLYCKEK